MSITLPFRRHSRPDTTTTTATPAGPDTTTPHTEDLFRVAQLRDDVLVGLGSPVSLATAIEVRDYCAEHPAAEYPQDVYRVVAA